MIRKMIFDLRYLTREDVKEELGPVLADPGYIAQLEGALADFVGKRVKVIFREMKGDSQNSQGA